MNALEMEYVILLTAVFMAKLRCKQAVSDELQDRSMNKQRHFTSQTQLFQ